VTIGRVVGIHGPVLWGTLYDDEDNTAASAARMGALVSLRGPESRVFGVVNALRRERDGGGTQGERTVFEIQTLGEIPTTGPEAAAAGFQRGVSRYPPLGAPVTTVTIRDLAKVYAGRAPPTCISAACATTRRCRLSSSPTACWASISPCSARPAPASRARSP
jgi:hypothetical protein